MTLCSPNPQMEEYLEDAADLDMSLVGSSLNSAGPTPVGTLSEVKATFPVINYLAHVKTTVLA